MSDHSDSKEDISNDDNSHSEMVVDDSSRHDSSRETSQPPEPTSEPPSEPSSRPGSEPPSDTTPQKTVVDGFYSFKTSHPLGPSEEYRNCSSYDILPTMALIHGSPIYSLASTWGMRYVFTGSEDGIIRMYDFATTVAGKQLLTINQRHMMPDSITKGGVLVAYWENEQPLFDGEYKVGADHLYEPKLSPTYSLAVQSEALWLCSGLESGGITMQTVRCGSLDPGTTRAYLDGHKAAVSDLKLSGDDTKLLSASWDKSIVYWDLNTGGEIQRYSGLVGQLSTVEWQPIGAPAVGPAPTLSSGADTSMAGGDDDDDKSMGSLFGSDDDENEAKEEKEEQEAEAEDKSEEKPDEKADERNTGNIFLSATYNGKIDIWDVRASEKVSFGATSEAPPWCMSACWSWDGSKVYAGRRNSTVEEYDIRNMAKPSRTLKFPTISGAVSSVTPMPNGHSLLCGSHDNIRLYDLNSQRKTPFYIVPGHHGAVVSRMLFDQTCMFLLTASGGRGWLDSSTGIVLGYEVQPENSDGNPGEHDAP